MMALQAPNLDDRKFQDIVSEARTKIPLYCPRWTDYNLSDPGITLIEIFSWMVDMLLYRLNRVPEKHYIKFMDLIGIRLEPPKPATVNVTFRLSAPQPESVTIPYGTEVATVRTETEDAITFTTNQDFTIPLPTLAYALTTPDDSAFTDVMSTLKNPDIYTPVFQGVPEENNALYLGYSEELNALTLALTIQSSIEGVGVDPRNPPMAWEYWDGEQERWSLLRLESDTTGGLNTNGQVILHIPSTVAMTEVDGTNAYWIRCRATKPSPSQRGYGSSPRVRSIVSDSMGCTVPASHASRITNEFLGRSDGTPGQIFHLLNVPLLSREPGETIEVETENEGEFEPWQEVIDFADSGPTDPHFTCDSVSGEVQFGPSIRQPTGQEKQYGKVPPNGRRIRFASYRSGGGVIGNVGEGTITVLKSSIPYVDSVKNFEGAKGGTDAETMDSVILRAPRVLRANIRAVTNEDFEYLAVEASPRVARAKCISPGDTADAGNPPPGTVRVLLVPLILDGDRYIPPELLEVPRLVREEVESYLDERRLLATRLVIDTAQYVPVAVEAQVKAKRGSTHQKVAAEVEKRLYQYINPVCGGEDGQGWPFGRSLNLSEIYAALQGIARVDYIEEVKIFPVDPDTDQRQEATTMITIPPNAVLCSHKHEVTVAG
ncbi:putative baseplate assembly protein [Chloroflexota bacterium]